MKSKEMDVRQLVEVGFDFLQSCIISTNANYGNLTKLVKPASQAQAYSYSNYYYVPYPPL